MAVYGYMLWQVMNILDMLGCFHNCHNLFWHRVRFCISTCYKHHQKLLLHMNKVIEVSALNS